MARGYPDWQRVVDWHSEPLVQHTQHTLSTPFEIVSISEVSRWHGLNGRFRSRSGRQRLTLAWYSDMTLAWDLGVYDFIIPHLGEVNVSRPHLGRVLVVRIDKDPTVASVQHDLILQNTNRLPGPPVVPAENILASVEGVSVPAGGTDTVTWSTVYGGPVFVFISTTITNYVFTIRSYLLNGTTERIFRARGPQDGDTFRLHMILPTRPCDWTMQNNDAAPALYSAAMIASYV